MDRISSEAPVPAFQVKKRSEARGDAGNVVSNVIGLGSAAAVIGLRGADEAGQRLAGLLRHDRLADLSIECADRSTITNTRLVSKGQQLLRMNEEETRTAALDIVNEVIRRVEDRAAETDAIVISDYGKGLLQSEGSTQAAVAIGRRGIPVFVDPKSRD